MGARNVVVVVYFTRAATSVFFIFTGESMTQTLRGIWDASMKLSADMYKRHVCILELYGGVHTWMYAPALSTSKTPQTNYYKILTSTKKLDIVSAPTCTRLFIYVAVQR